MRSNVLLLVSIESLMVACGFDAPVEVVSPCTDCRIGAIWGSAEDDVWFAAGDLDTARMFHWDGSRVVEAPLPGRAARSDLLWGSGPDDVWAVSHSTSDLAEVLHWNGTEWSIALDFDAGQVVVEDLWGSSPTNVWMVGYISVEPTDRQTLALRWDGAGWAEVDLPFLGGYQWPLSVWTTGPSDVWILHTGEGAGLAHWDGTSWRSIMDPYVGSGAFVLNTNSRVRGATPGHPMLFGTVSSEEQAGFVRWDGARFRDVGPVLPSDAPQRGHQFFVVSESDVWTLGQAHYECPADRWPECDVLSRFDGTRWHTIFGDRFEWSAVRFWASPTGAWLGSGNRVLRAR